MERVLAIIADSYDPLEILDILSIDSQELVEKFGEDILEYIKSTGEFGEADRVNKDIRESWLLQIETESFS